jgi:SAM-dependent methyltransferase
VTDGTDYDSSFHAEMADLGRSSAEVVVPIVLRFLRVRSVVDIGCGAGAWLSVFSANGVGDLVGIDGPGVDHEQLEISPEDFRVADLADPPELGRGFDLAVCLEVAEHLPEAVGDAFVGWLSSLAPVVLFSAAVPHQGGTGHHNEQWPSYWAERFGVRGFRPVDVLRPLLWHDERVQWWYAQNCIFYASPRGMESFTEPLPASACRTPPLALVHPNLFLRVIDWAVEQQAERWKSAAGDVDEGLPS